jgi:molecular chaperone HscC
MTVGIDLGTTNSLIGVWQEGRPELIPNALHEVLTPSVVGIDDNGDILVGKPAQERMLTHPELTASVFKRYMGTTKTVSLGKHAFRPEELSSFVLRRLKEDAEVRLGQPVEEAVISVPAYFNDTQRKATRAAGQLAGLRVDRLINEPTAAALAYGLRSATAESQFLIYDLGGGTFDVTILELFEGVMEVRASCGDNFLGGEDFVKVLIDRFMERIGIPAGMKSEDMENGVLYQIARREAERAKRRLSDAKSAAMEIPWEGKSLTFQFTEADLISWADPLLVRLRTPVERALRDAKIRPSELNEILLVGGATRMPIIRNMATRMFGRFPNVSINPEEAVALGAAVQAGLKDRDAALREIVLTDMCPYTLGVEVCEEIGDSKAIRTGMFLPILERNTVVPASRVQTLASLADNQKELDLRVFQGESRKAQENIFLGSLRIPVPRGPKGKETVDVRFTYDINGLLEVEATVVSTGLRKSLIIEENPGVLNADEIIKRFEALAKLKIHPRDQTENRTLLARAERLYQEHLSESRLMIGQWAKTFEDSLEAQDEREIAKTKKNLIEFLDQIEHTIL